MPSPGAKEFGPRVKAPSRRGRGGGGVGEIVTPGWVGDGGKGAVSAAPGPGG
jgi:hypothetical protein